MSKIEKTCENCEYENEDMEGTHCRHCIHNAEEHFAPKINHEKEIRNKAVDEFVIKLKRVRGYGLITNFDRPFGITFNKLDEIAEQLKGGAE